MKLELHSIQSFAPSNLNRDDTGSPKDCEFGGVRRARISSQCWKRAIRIAFKDRGLVSEDNRGERSRKIAGHVAKVIANGLPEETARRVAENALAAIGLKNTKAGDSEYLLFVSNFGLQQFAEACKKHWAALEKTKDPKKLPKDFADDLDDLMQTGRAIDVALFGRMIADRPSDNIDAASQVAHAISTHRADLEFDYYTAVDDLQPDADTGAGMIGSLEFNAACYYRYANIDVAQLSRNLDGQRNLVREGLQAFLSAAIEAIPSGKQNGTAAHNPPSFVLTVVRPSGLWSLANAFLKPVRPKAGGDLAESSIAELSAYWNKLAAVYGTPPDTWYGHASLHEQAGTAGGENCSSIGRLINATLIHIHPQFRV
jgi:CRISPR system Cascade subunit CasC